MRAVPSPLAEAPLRTRAPLAGLNVAADGNALDGLAHHRGLACVIEDNGNKNMEELYSCLNIHGIGDACFL